MKTNLKNKLKGMPLLNISKTFEKEGGYADLKLARAEIIALRRVFDYLDSKDSKPSPPMPPNLKNKS